MQVCKWGNSLAVRLPAAVAAAMDHKAGDHVVGTRSFEMEKRPDVKELLAPLREYRRRLPEGFKPGRIEAHERGWVFLRHQCVAPFI